MRLLFIGNSHTFYNSLPEMLRLLAEANGADIAYETCFGGGYTYADHWGTRRTRRLLEQGGWDEVILQPSGTESVTFEARETVAHGGKLAVAAGESGVIWFQTHAYDARSAGVQSRMRGLGGQALQRLPKMAECSRQLFEMLQREYGGRIARVGAAWEAVKAIPDAPNLYAADGYHPAPWGTLLGALVFYRLLFEASPKRVPDSLVVPAELGSSWGGKVELQLKSEVLLAFVKAVSEI